MENGKRDKEKKEKQTLSKILWYTMKGQSRAFLLVEAYKYSITRERRLQQ